MKQQTAIQWLEKIVDNMILNGGNEDLLAVIEHIQQAKQVEKEQMLNVFQESRLTHPMIGFKHQTFLEYYNETYGGQGSPDTTTSPNTQNK